MNEHLLALLVCLAVIAVLAILIYVSGRSQASVLAGICEARQTLNQILANTHNTVAAPCSLRCTHENQRRDKRVLKAWCLNPIISTAGSADPAVSKGVGFGTMPANVPPSSPIQNHPETRNARFDGCKKQPKLLRFSWV
jgi:hypothetical protein